MGADRAVREGGPLMRRITLVVPMLFVLVVIGPDASAQASKTYVSFTETTTSVTPPQQEWVSGTTYHFRGLVEVTAVAGDLDGTITAVINGDVNMNTGAGAAWGPFTFVTSTVTWSGSFRGDPEGSGTFIGLGNDGSTIHGSFVQTAPDILEDEAVILSPTG
jgi:hypothetical protein